MASGLSDEESPDRKNTVYRLCIIVDIITSTMSLKFLALHVCHDINNLINNMRLLSAVYPSSSRDRPPLQDSCEYQLARNRA
jgi:hypothetical protein